MKHFSSSPVFVGTKMDAIPWTKSDVPSTRQSLITAFLFEKGTSGEAASGPLWKFKGLSPEKDFFLLESLLFDKLEKIVSQEEVKLFARTTATGSTISKGFQRM